jgi:uncharacterized protein involved in response to NO
MQSNAPTIERPKAKQYALFAYGFRPFFLGAALQAVVAIPLWLLALEGLGADFHGMQPLQWHIHEMLFGFVGAAAAGFVLTAVPNWTTRRGYFGPPLMALFALWLAARITINPFITVPLWVPFLFDVFFIPALIGLILPSLVRSRNRKNYMIAGMLGLYGLANILCWLELMGWAHGTWDSGVTLGFDLVLLLVTVIGGRIVPSFTSSSLHRQGVEIQLPVNTWLDRAAILLTALLLFAHQFSDGNIAVAGIAAAAAVAHTIRWIRWQGWRTFDDPLLWILHVAYLWIPIALCLQVTFLLTGSVYASAWRHAYSAGVFSCMIMAVMSRAALGHTGRPLVAAKTMVFGYIALIFAGICRVLAPAFSENYQMVIDIAGGLWMLAFGIYLFIYTPILIKPRIDGRPG